MQKIFIILASIIVLSSCSSDSNEGERKEGGILVLSSSIENFVGEEGTRTNVDGTNFVNGDLIRLKLICPYTTDTQNGENTWNATADGFFLLKWNNGGWKTVTSEDKFDINWDYKYSGSSDIFSVYDAQPTPYVFTASTWTEERVVRTVKDGIIDQYCHVFHHDQTREKNYLASDLLWAQQFSQTGTWNIRLNFKHVLACLKITIDDSALPDNEKISSDAVLTIGNMPNIDQQEIVVGDYYAHKSKDNEQYGYRQKASCKYENNGKVLGIGIMDETQSKAVVKPFSGSPEDTGLGTSYRGTVIPNNGTYICHKSAEKVYRVIVPPCSLSVKPVLWLRDDNRRYTMNLEQTEFQQGHLYKITMTVKKAEQSE